MMNNKKKYKPHIPVVNDPKEREDFILKDHPAVFEIESNKFSIDLKRKSNIDVLGYELNKIKNKVWVFCSPKIGLFSVRKIL